MPLLRLRLASEPVATVSTETLTKLEGKGFAKILSRSPDFWRDMGWQLTDGILATDSLSGMNDRILKARKSTGRAVPAFTFYWDTSEVGIDKFEFARGLAQGRVPISFRGVGRQGDRLRYHDVFLHAPIYVILPEAVSWIVQDRMAFLLHLYADYPTLRVAVGAYIETQISLLDDLTAAFNHALSGSRRGSREDQVDYLAFLFRYYGYGTHGKLTKDLASLPEYRALGRDARFDVYGRASDIDENFVDEALAKTTAADWVSRFGP